MLTLRLTVAAAFLISGGNQLKADHSFTCPVTKLSEQTFVPPAPWGDGGHWFGTEKLWTGVDMYWGHWFKDEQGYYVPKTAWFSSTFDWTLERWSHERLLTITGRRLDGPSKPLIFDGASNAYMPGRPFITASAHLPTAGCREITGHSNGENLTFVVKIVP